MHPILASMLLSLLPVIELRGGIPLAISLGVHPIDAFIFCTLANILIIIPIFLFLDLIHKKLVKFKLYNDTFNQFVRRTKNRKKKVEKKYNTYGILALTLFVAIPLPITGAWTGSFIAWLLNLNRKKSFFAISLGIIIAGILVTLIATGVISAFKFLI